MRGSLVTSAILHAMALALAMVTLGAPEPLEVQPTEALPVDLVPITEFSNIQQGEKKAPLKEKSSPKATTRQDKVQNAENAGENDVDLKNPPTPTTRPQQVEAAAAPKPVEKVQPKQDETPNEVEQVQKEETAPPPPPEKAVPQPKPEPAKPEPKPQEVAKAEETPPPPDAVPVPGAKPQPEKPKEEKPKQEEAKAEEKPVKDVKPAEKPKTSEAKTTDKNSKSDSKSKSSDSKKGKENKETAKSKASRETDQLADEVAALLNKEDASGGGAKRSNEQASLGGKKTTGAGKLSQSEMDALKGAIQNNWNVIPGMLDAADIRIRVSFQLDRNGEVMGDPDVKVTGGDGNARDVLASSALRAILKSAPFTNLPPDKYDTWRDIVVNFDPSDFM